ncbi:MAG: hypothetical protein ACFFD4_35200 [Candidatus Odinarchaeota archaeon]
MMTIFTLNRNITSEALLLQEVSGWPSDCLDRNYYLFFPVITRGKCMITVRTNTGTASTGRRMTSRMVVNEFKK